MKQTLSAKLSTGTITVEVDRSTMDPSALFDFAERCNPKRSFLFVSKVLGRHIPVRPSVMRRTFVELATQIPLDLPGPVLVTGMAETAIGIGAGVQQEYERLRAQHDSIYLCTTRHALGTSLLAEFQEEHSHASHHLLHRPVDPISGAMVMNAKTLIMVDDEATTGKTFANLHRALIGAGLDKIERVVLVTLTDWSDGRAADAIGPETLSVSLLAGRYRWQAEPGTSVPPVVAPECFLPDLHAPNPLLDWGRLGARAYAPSMIPNHLINDGENRVLVVGTGEHVWDPYLIAEHIAQNTELDVHFYSVSRSPIANGYAISSGVSFADNYGLGVANYLYNHNPDDYDRIILCVETPGHTVDPTLINALGREKVSIVSATDCHNLFKKAS